MTWLAAFQEAAKLVVFLICLFGVVIPIFMAVMFNYFRWWGLLIVPLTTLIFSTLAFKILHS